MAWDKEHNWYYGTAEVKTCLCFRLLKFACKIIKWVMLHTWLENKTVIILRDNPWDWSFRLIFKVVKLKYLWILPPLPSLRDHLNHLGTKYSVWGYGDICTMYLTRLMEQTLHLMHVYQWLLTQHVEAAWRKNKLMTEYNRQQLVNQISVHAL